MYNRIYRVNYEKDLNKKAFILDLISLSEDYTTIEDKIKNGTKYKEDEKNILNNGKYVIIALLGLSYMLINKDIEWDEIQRDSSIIKEPNFTYGKFVSNYKNDDYMDNLEQLIDFIVLSLTETYNQCERHQEITSVSNLFTTDKKYRDNIVKDYMYVISTKMRKPEFIAAAEILKR